MTLDKCAAYCSKYAFFGVEYGQECFCGNALLNNSRNQSASSCNVACPGNATELCGGGNRLNLYLYNTSAAAATTSVSPGVSASTKVRRNGFWDFGEGLASVR